MAKTRKKHIRPQRQSRKLVVPPLDTKTRPGNDFYMFVNRKWLKKASLPTYESSYGVSEEIEDKIRAQLLGAVHELLQTKAELNPLYNLIRVYFHSGMHANFHDDHFKTFKRMMAAFGCMKGPEDIATELGGLIAMGIPTLLNVRLARDIEHPDDNVLSIDLGYLSLPDTSYYKGDAPGKLETLRGFEQLMKTMGEHLEYDGLDRIATMESHVASIYDRANMDEPAMITGQQLRQKYAKIPWTEFWLAYGLKDDEWIKMKFLISSETWLNWLNRQFQIMPLNDWVIWFRSAVLLWAAPLLPGPYDTLYFNYFGRRLRGDLEKMTQEYLLYYMGQTLLQVAFSSLYAKCCISAEHQAEVRAFAQKIRASAIKRIEDVNWLKPKSRELTAKKISAMELSIAEVDSGRYYKIPDLSEVDILFNMAELARASTDRDIYYARHPILKLPVMDAVYEVNAHYYISGNRLVIPGGITFWPFYKSGSVGWNYGGLGAVIGHEMLHAFDEDGSDYDNKGVYRPWWSRSDMAAYARKSKAIIRVFSGSEVFGRHINGKATLSENIADLGGLAISLDALKRHLKSAGVNDATRKKELQQFFISYAVSWRTKERRKRALYRLYSDVHAPPELRVNNIVAQIDDWYEVFDIQPGDRLYVDPKDRVSIF